MENNNYKLIFIYNADSDVISVVKDFFHKIVRPSTYQCRLCGVTYGVFGMKTDWKKFIENLDIKVDFLHRDEFEEKYDIINANYPSAYIEEEGNLKLFISAEEMNSINSLDEMEAIVLIKLQKHQELII